MLRQRQYMLRQTYLQTSLQTAVTPSCSVQVSFHSVRKCEDLSGLRITFFSRLGTERVMLQLRRQRCRG